MSRLGLVAPLANRFRDEIAVGVVACVSFATLIYIAGGIPYGLDGNETFSSIVHAYNLLNFDFSFAKGLADETYSSSPAAHSFVHTHQGNFPRLFAALLYGMGLKSPEAQVIATALTVGVASVVLWFRFIADVFNRRVAAITTAFLLTDYVLFLQWHLVTYRTWHLFFISACFYSVHAFARSGDRRWYGALFGIWCALFYYEWLFATFTATAVGLWTLWAFQSRPKLAFSAVGVCLVGAIAGFGTVLVQLALFLGWDGALQDLLSTLLARNAAGSVADSMAQIKAFADEHHIVFFLNLIDGGTYRTFDFTIRCLTSWGLLVYSPLFAQLIIQIAAAAVIHSAHRSGTFNILEYHSIAFACVGLLIFALPGTSGLLLACFFFGGIYVFGKWLTDSERLIVAKRRGSTVGHKTVFLWIVWYAALLADQRTLGDASNVFLSLGPVAVVLAAAVAGCCTAYGVAVAAGTDSKPDTAGRINLFLLICIAVAGIAGVHTLPPSSTFWIQALGGGWFASFGPKIVLAGSAISLVVLALGPDRTVEISNCESANALTEPDAHAGELGILALCVLGALLLVVLLLPGYLYSGYMVRYCNFLAPFFAVLVGYGLSWLIGISGSRIRDVGVSVRAASVIGIVTAATITICWCAAQSIMVGLIPPGEFAELIAALRQHPGATVVSNTYAAPFFVATGGWAYLDSKFGTAQITRDSAGYSYVHDTTYRWLADGARNPEYGRPSLYVCYATRSLTEAMQSRLENAKPQSKSGCGGERLVDLAKLGDRSYWPSPKLLATDPAGGDRWAIVANDYDFPPYLDGYPDAVAATRGANLEIAVDYRYRHQAGVPEAKSMVFLIALPAGARNCQVEGRTLASAEGQSGHADLVLPKSQVPEGSLVVTVEPATATRRGFAEYSAPIELSGSTSARASNCSMNQHATPR